MKESYQDFIKRISVFEKRDLDLGKSYFKGKPSLKNKIDENNRLKDFFGDTVVFDLDKKNKEKISIIIDEIYTNCPECFAEKLKSETLHMTLHDLSNSPKIEDIEGEMSRNDSMIKDIINHIGVHKIKMRANFIFNMVNTSLVLGLVPLDEGEYDKLLRLYCLIDESVKEAQYPLTPHITLAYYSINGFDEKSRKALEDLVYRLNAVDIRITLDTKNLFYQRFYSMNDYKNIIKLA